MCFLSIFPLAGLLMIALLIGLKIVTLKRKGIVLTAGKSNTSAKNLFLYLFFLFVLLIWMASIINQTFNLLPFLKSTLLIKTLLSSQLLKSFGAVVILISVLLLGTTLVHFRNSLRFGIAKSNQGDLVTTGIFAFSRNPFFLSLDLYFIGQAIVFPGILFIAIAFMAMMGIHLFIKKEEKFLQEHYGSRYFNYKQKVGRYL